MAPPLPPPAAGKKSVWPYVLFGCLGLILISVLGMVATGLFVFNKVKQAGLDPELMQKNPAVAITKMIAAVNPDIEIINVDESRGIVTVRDKKQNKVLTLNFEDIKNGKIVFEEPGKGKVEIKGEGGQMQISTPEGTAEIGTGKMTLPGWIPKYASVDTVGLNVASPKGGTVSFTTADDPVKVGAFYDGALKQAGLTVSKNSFAMGGASTVTVAGEADGKKVNITAAVSDGKTQVTIMYESN